MVTVQTHILRPESRCVFHIKESYFLRIVRSERKVTTVVRLVKTTGSSIAFESFDYVISVSDKAVFRKGRKWEKHLQIQIFKC